MEDIVVGLLAVAVGALFCFWGWLVLRVVIPIWGAFAGFMLGAGLVAELADEGFLATVLGWIVGLGAALLFGLLAYLYYEVAVVLTMAAIGFVLAANLMVALGVTWSWLVVIGGVVLAVLLSWLAIAGNMPMVILVVLSALAGAGTIVSGLMLLFGVIDLETIQASTTRVIDDDWWWYALYIGLAVAGMVAQIRAVDRLTASLREAWTGSGGQQPA